MTRITLLLTAALMCHLSLAGCQPMAKEYRPGPDGRYHKVGTFTVDENWRRSRNREIDEEVSGKPVSGPYRSWGKFWQSYYATLRKDDDPILAKRMGYKDYLHAEDMIAYIKQQRRARGLPAVD